MSNCVLTVRVSKEASILCRMGEDEACILKNQIDVVAVKNGKTYFPNLDVEHLV